MVNGELPDKWQKKDSAKVKKIGKKKQKSIYYKGVIVIFGIFMCYFSVLFINQHMQRNEMESRLFELREEIKVVKSINEELQKEVELLYNPEYIESLARKELGLIKPDEIIFNVDRSRYVYQEKNEE